MATLKVTPCLRARQLKKIPTGLWSIHHDIVYKSLIDHQRMLGISEIPVQAKKLLSLEVYGYMAITLKSMMMQTMTSIATACSDWRFKISTTDYAEN